ncbi:MAG: class I SAM-dependent methyltransferase [Parvularculaceae bacterium]
MNLRQVARRAVDRLGLVEYYFRYAEWRLAREKEKSPAVDADGVPIPPLYLMALVAGHADWRGFLSSGEAHAAEFARHASESGLPFERAGRILDFGCGCGRVLRHLPKLTGAALYGVDYNPLLLRWCARNLKGEFARNRLRPPLRFPDAHFDIIYLLSVFTHLRIETQRDWLEELWRVTRTGGLVLATFHDEEHASLPDLEEARASLKETGVFIYNDRAEGSNFIATFQAREFSRRLFAERFEVLRIVPSSESGLGQALAVLRKPSSGAVA